MFGSTGILIALLVVTIALAAMFLVRSSITQGATGKILAFVGLCALPALCIGTGMSFQNQRSKQTRFCISCHKRHGESLYFLNPNYIPAHHFQDHLVPPDRACYSCHTDYAIYGPLKDKLRGLWNFYMQYMSTSPKTNPMPGGYSNLLCLQCHASTRDFEEHLSRMPPLASLESNQVSCISSGCHDLIHNVSEVDHKKMWTEGVASTSLAPGLSSPASAKAKPGATGGASKAPTGSSSATTTRGKGLFDSQRCSGCHGTSGGGGVGPALTHISSQYPPAKLTALLKAPTARMKAAGMVPLTLKAADMKALVSYVTSLGGASAAKAKPGAAGGASKAPTGSSSAAATRGKGLFDSQRCSGCHGTSGGGGVGPALTYISSQYPPDKLKALLKAPTARMRAAGMVPLTLKAADMKALVSYVSSFEGTSAASSPASPAAGAPMNQLESKGELIFNANACAMCHGTDGVSGSTAGPPLAGTRRNFTPATLTTLLQHPTALMTRGGMPAVSLGGADLKALVAYVIYICASKSHHPTTFRPR